MRIKLSPSIMCSDYANLEGVLEEIEAFGVDIIHVDVMDGHYVPNMIIGPDYVETLRRLTRLPLDIHLMCEKPENFIPMFDPQPGERLSFHTETTYHPHRLLVDIKKRGCLAGVAMGPHQPASALEELIPDIDYVTVMTIDTGIPASTFLPKALDKIEKIKSMACACKKEVFVQVDGSINFDNVVEVVQKGADVLVLGYPGCFNKEFGTIPTLTRIRNSIKDL